MHQQSTASVDLTGVKSRVKLGCLFAAAVLSLASITGCGPKPMGARANAVVPGKRLPNVVFIGDSITANWSESWSGTSFTQHTNWINEGIIGQNSNQVLARFQSDVIDLHPDIVVILVGTNDVYPGWTLGPSFVPDVFQNNIDSPANVEQMVQMTQAAYIRVILATIPPWNCDASNCALAESTDPTQSRYTRIEQWNTWLKGYAFTEGIPVVDYHYALVSSDREMYPPASTIDGVHPTPVGYAIMEPMVSQAIDQVWADFEGK